jgi:hypothetical protein
MTPDPFTIIEQSLWRSMELCPELTSVVKLANRVKYSSTNDVPLRDNPQAGDLPELQLLPDGGSINAPGSGVSSSSISIQQNYTLAMSTDELRTAGERCINRVKWGVVLAILRMHKTEPMPGVSMVRRVDASTYRDGLVNQGAADRLLPGWSSVLSITVSCVIPKTEVGL